jgi:hypothetical protein
VVWRSRPGRGAAADDDGEGASGFFCVWVAEGDREGDLDRVFVATPFFLGVIIYID